MLRALPIAAVGVALVSSAGKADVQVFSDYEQWQAAIASYTTIGFTGFPDFTIITDQYADQGALFADGNDSINCCEPLIFPRDGAGLEGNDAIRIIFDHPQTAIAVHLPGAVIFELFDTRNLFYESDVLGGVQAGAFAGLISDQPFDAVTLSDDIGDIFIDDLHFGTIPAPGATSLLVIGALAPRRRRRAGGGQR
jgi:hypothetical protein